MADVFTEKELEYAIVTDREGNIIYNGMTGDGPVLRREYTDGVIEIIRKQDGVVINRYHPEEYMKQPTCKHCGKVPF